MARRAGNRGETVASLIVLAVLAAVAAGMAWKQGRYDPELLRPLPPVKAATAADGAGIRATPTGEVAGGGPAGDASAAAGPSPGFPVPAGLIAAGPAESFDAEHLSDKIDGKADLYLSAGFRRLDCRRLAPEGQPDAWIEACAYDMGTFRGAFAVFSRQRRPEAKGAGLAGFAYRTPTSLHAVQGRFYLEATQGQPGAGGKAQKAWVEAFAAAHPAAPGDLGDVALLPVEGRAENGLVLHARDAFGFDRFDDVLAADYVREGGRGTAWVSRRDGPDAAAALVRAWRDLLVENGGEVREPPAFAPDGVLVEVMGTWELAFHRGALLLGVHEASSRDLALALGRDLDAAAGRDR